ncbi:MAG: heavy metal-associated domain-containing protein [Nanoarchaeota archaeon]|nr:heavy metal-associated domain-containing protein [Nanoarchaeota archaeon]
MKTAKIEISGMHCSSCASNVERSLSKVPGVKNPKISLLLKKGSVELEGNVPEEELKKAVARVGYKATKITYE